MTKKKVTAVTVGTDDIYFIIANKETSILKLMNDIEKQSQTIEKQSQTIQQLSDRLIVVETQLKK